MCFCVVQKQKGVADAMIKACKSSKIPLLHHLCEEGILPCSPVSFFTSWCCSPWGGCASCCIGRGPAILLRCGRRHRSLRPHGACASVCPNPLRGSPQSRTATHVCTAPTLALRHP